MAPTLTRSPWERLKDNYCWRGATHFLVAVGLAAAFVTLGPYLLSVLEWAYYRQLFQQAVDNYAPWLYQASSALQYPLWKLLGSPEKAYETSVQINSLFFCAVGSAAQMLTFWGTNALFTLAYKFQPAWIEYYKVSMKPWPWNGSPKERSEYFMLVRKSILLLVFNHLIFVPVAILSMYPLVELRGHGFVHNSAPTVLDFVAKMIIFILIEDTGFYWLHRLLHHKAIYKHIHKVHHQYKDATIGIASEYAHPVEFVISNLVPLSIGPLLFHDLHAGVWTLWIIWRIAETCCGHSGYELPFVPFHLLPFQSSVAFHDFHHSRNVGNYSSMFSYWDWLMGTDEHYLRHLEKYGHVTDDRYQKEKKSKAAKAA